MQNDSVLITDVLPGEILKATFEMLPASHLFIAPVCRHFHDLYGAAIETNKTFKYSVVTEAALELYLNDMDYDRERLTSMIGAGCGRTDWVERGGSLEEDTCSAAAKGGQLRLLQWLRGRDCPWNSDTCKGAALHGHLETLQWARGEECPWDKYTCEGAAEGGQLATLRWLRQEGCPWDRRTCAAAARGGHLETLRWARGEGCPWDVRTCEEAARGGQLQTLQWLRGEGCPWSAWTCAVAAAGGHLEVLRWCVENGCPYDENQQAFRAILDPEFLEWFEEHKSKLPPSPDSN